MIFRSAINVPTLLAVQVGQGQWSSLRKGQ